MSDHTPPKEQLERVAEFRAAIGDAEIYNATDATFAALAALLGLPKPEPKPKELEWKHFPSYHRSDDEPGYLEAKPGDYTDTTDDDGDFLDRTYTDDLFERRDEYRARLRAEETAGEAAVNAESAAYSEKREASIAAVKQWDEDNTALREALLDWKAYFFRLDYPKDAAEQDAEESKQRREDIAKVFPDLIRFLKMEVTHSTIADLVADAYSEWTSLGEETRTNADNMEEHFPSKAEEWGECADTLENFSQPDVPDKIKDVQIAFFVRKYSNARHSRNQQACDQLDLVIDYLQEHEDEDDEGLASELEDAKGEADGLSFPGMY